MTAVKTSRPGHWADIHVATSLATAEADERADIERMNRWMPLLAWAIGAVAVFGCMSFAWWKA